MQLSYRHTNKKKMYTYMSNVRFSEFDSVRLTNPIETSKNQSSFNRLKFDWARFNKLASAFIRSVDDKLHHNAVKVAVEPCAGESRRGSAVNFDEYYAAIRGQDMIPHKPHLGGVYWTPGRLSRRGEFTPVPSHSSTFVYMISPQNVMPARVARA